MPSLEQIARAEREATVRDNIAEFANAEFAKSKALPNPLPTNYKSRVPCSFRSPGATYECVDRDGKTRH